MSIARRFSFIVAATLAVAAVVVPGAQATWTFPSWTLPSTESQFAGSSCSSSTFCFLVGNQTPGSTRGLLYRYNGTDYTATTPASTTAEFYGVGCTNTAFCMAVGTDFTGSTGPRAERYNGTTWDNTSATTPASSTITALRGVSCAATTTCAAAGFYKKATIDTALIETWNGSAWSMASLTQPSGTVNAQLADVSCTTTTTCTAVGYFDSVTVRTPLVYRLSGATWTTQSLTSVVPAGSTGAQLSGVSCFSNTHCTAVGFWADSSGVGHGLAFTWNNTSWATKAVPDPGTGQDLALSDVSCYAASGCIAVGGFTDSTTFNQEPTAALWNGTSWALQTVTRPTGVSDQTLRGVSCPSSTTCRAGGVSTTTSNGTARPAIAVGT